MHFLLSVFTGSTELLLQWFDLWGCLSGKTQCAPWATAPGDSECQWRRAALPIQKKTKT